MSVKDKPSAGFQERSMGLGIRFLRQIAGTELIDRIRLREPLERVLYSVSRTAPRAAGAANRAFARVSTNGADPERLVPKSPGGLFDLRPDDEQQMLREAFREFAANQIRPAALDADANCETPEELLAAASELGLAMLGVPESLGGAVSESSAVTSTLAIEAVAGGDAGIATAALAPAAVATALALHGDAAQQQTYLPVLVGEAAPAAALAILEKRALFDPFKLETTAAKTADGYTLTGAKSLVPRAATAELFLVAAQTESGPCLLLVESGSDGLTTSAEPAMGLRAAATATLHLDDVKVPATAILENEDGYADVIRRSRLAWCALAVGVSQAVLDYVIPYVNERKAFGEPISHRQAVAFNVSDIAIELEGMRLLTYRAASLADAGKPFAHEAALARRFAAEKAMKIGSDGVQLLGGHGYIKEHPVERWYRDLRGAGLMEGVLLV